MEIFTLATKFFTGILIGYLSLTNALAERIESFLPTKAETEVVMESPERTEESSFEKLTQLSKTLANGIPRVLLDHVEFQRAAVLASKRDEETAAEADDIPLSELVENSLVNIYCQYKTKEYIRTTTGSGFFINQKGVILTNAHVAQFLLLTDTNDGGGDTECVIRTGNPATPKYNAELLYISPTWIYDNADLITDEAPRGTGERDYALLYVSGSVDDSPLPARFPFIPVDTGMLPRSVAGDTVVTAGYPAELLIRNGPSAKLLPAIASTKLQTLYTFGSSYADIFSISESPVGEQGASGGPVASESDRSVIGLIVTKGDEKTEGAHSLRALTLSYVDRTITEETGFSLLQNMQGDLALRGSIFKKAMVPFLAGILNDQLNEKKN